MNLKHLITYQSYGNVIRWGDKIIEWEYYTIPTSKTSDQELNKLGREGWELVWITERKAIFKRKIEQD